MDKTLATHQISSWQILQLMCDQNYGLVVTKQPIHYTLLKKMPANVYIQGRKWIILNKKKKSNEVILWNKNNKNQCILTVRRTHCIDHLPESR